MTTNPWHPMAARIRPKPTRLVSVDARQHPPRASVCALCDEGGELAAALDAAGYSVEHVMCPACEEREARVYS